MGAFTGAANRFPDSCNADPDGARAINVEASRHLASNTSKSGALLLYISTDYVFPGKQGDAPYEANARPEPTNIYGQTKFDGEKAILEATKTSGLGLVLRVPVLYGKAKEAKESAVNVLMDALWKGQEKDAHIKMDDWAQRYPTNTEDVARVCLDICTKYLEDPVTRQKIPKTLQFSSEDKMTKYEICQVFADIMGLPLGGITPDRQSGDPNAGVVRPYDTHLSTKTLKQAGINVNTQDFKAWWCVAYSWTNVDNADVTKAVGGQVLSKVGCHKCHQVLMETPSSGSLDFMALKRYYGDITHH